MWHRINIIFLPLGDVKDIVQLSKKRHPGLRELSCLSCGEHRALGSFLYIPPAALPSSLPDCAHCSVSRVCRKWVNVGYMRRGLRDDEKNHNWWCFEMSSLQIIFLTEINVGPWDGGRSFSWYNFEVFQHINRMGVNQCTRFEIMFRIWLFTVLFTVHLNVLGSAGFYLAFRMQNMVGFCNQTCVSTL